MAEFSEWEKKLEKIQNERAKEISKKSEWARLLNCKPDKKPWTMSFNMFGAANKLITRIERISDQELLALIAREARRLDIKCAAIRNITDQKLLKFFLCSNNQLIREAAITHLEDQKLLEELALDEHYNSIDVRRAAIAKLKNPAVLQKISGSNAFSSVREAAMLRRLDIEKISGDNLVSLAISSEWVQVKLAALKKLPPERNETKLLQAAAMLSSNSTDENRSHFQELCAIVAKENPLFFKQIVNSYPDANIQTLTKAYLPILRISALYEKIKSNFDVAPLPTHIILNYDNIQLFCGSTLIKKIAFSDYGFSRLVPYSSWYSCDGHSSEPEINQLMLLAERINQRLNVAYNIHNPYTETVCSPGTECEQHIFIQKYIIMEHKQMR